MNRQLKYVMMTAALVGLIYFLIKTFKYTKERMDSPFKYFTWSEFDSGATASEIADPNVDTYFSARHGNYRLSGSGKANISANFIHDLDAIREEVGFPMIINSGYRTPAWNDHVGGVANSSHRKSPTKAADVVALTYDQKMAIATAAIKRGITRFGFGNSYIHLDKDSDKDQHAIWNYGTAREPTSNELFT